MEPKDDDTANADRPFSKKAVSFPALQTQDNNEEQNDCNARNNDHKGVASLPPNRPTLTSIPPRPKLTRSQNCRHFDLSTGQNTRRQQSIQAVDPRHCEARSRWKKVTSRLFLQHPTTNQAATKSEKLPEDAADRKLDHPEDEESRTPTVQQFRIRSRVLYNEDEPSVLLGGGKKRRRRRGLLGCLSSWWISSALDGRSEMGASAITDLLTWSYQAYFFQVIIAIVLLSMALTIIFALLIYINVYLEPGCISVGNTTDFDIKNNKSFMDAYQLSWTTMVTTGYGLVNPKTPTAENRCLGINVLMALESFVGVLFAGITGAIVFAKIARYQSIALVLFSQPICVRYGTGVIHDTPVLDDDCGSDVGDSNISHLPFPILEFRIINQLSREKGGEIMNASVSVVASVLQNDEESDGMQLKVREKTPSLGISNMVGQAASFTTDAATKAAATVSKAGLTVGKAGLSVGMAGTHVAKTTGKALFGAAAKTTQLTGNVIQQLNKTLMGSPRTLSLHEVDENTEAEPYNQKEIQEIEKELEKEFEKRFAEKLKREQAMLAPVSTLRATATSIAVSEGNSKLAPPRIYHKLEIETDSHPFFKRVWNIRHVLNEESPLLSRKARNMIIENNGNWPKSLNNWQAIRHHLRFNDIIVSFTGIGNASGTSVCAQKVYSYINVNIGYTFVNVLVHENGVLGVDAVLLNDVKEQMGGGGEPLDVAKASTYAEAVTKMAEGVVDATRNVAETTKTKAEEVTTTAVEAITEVTKPLATGISDTVTRTGDTLRSKYTK